MYASSDDPTLQLGRGDDVIGSSLDDPLGATYGQVYLADNAPYYVVWNDDFYGNPIKPGGSPWGHSKGILAWNDSGEGFVLQVSTPSWPGAGNKAHPRQNDGNTLGFVHDDDIEVSQHFFALRLNQDDVLNVLAGLQHASVRTDPKNPVAVHSGGPAHIQAMVRNLGRILKDTNPLNIELSTGVRLLVKPSALHVPPWQMVSALLGGVDLRVANWWAHPYIPSTTRENATPGCWDPSLPTPGAVDIATTGSWAPPGKDPVSIGLLGRPNANGNHAKFAVSTSKGKTLSIFGDQNQQGSLLAAKAKSSQNGRGGMFFVVDDKRLFSSITSLLKGESAPTTIPTSKSKKKATTKKK